MVNQHLVWRLKGQCIFCMILLSAFVFSFKKKKGAEDKYYKLNNFVTNWT